MSPLHDFNLANQTPASYRTDHNNNLNAIASNNASSSGITTTFAHMWYTDVSSSGWVRQRNAADSTFNYIFKTDSPGGVCTYGGSPSTNHIGRHVGQWVWDTSNSRYYYCTLAGTSSSASWSMVASSSAYNQSAYPDGYLAGKPPTYNSASQVIIPGGFKCRDSGNTADIGFSTAYTIDITVSGAGGLSTDLTETSSQWYYLFAIRKSGDGTINGILTTATSAPTLPSGYDQYRMVPIAIRNSSVGDFLPFTMVGFPHQPWVIYSNYESGDASPYGVLTAGSVASFTAVTTSKLVPPVSKGLIKVGGQLTWASAGVYSGNIRQGSNALSTGTVLGEVDGSGANDNWHFTPTDVLVRATDQSIDYKVSSTNARLYLSVMGFQVTEIV